MVTNPISLSQIPLFARLTPAELEALSLRCLVREYEQDTVIFRQGEPGEALYIVTEGLVRISYARGEGETAVLVLLGPGEFFGELSLLDGLPRSATATAVAPTRVVLLEKPDFLRFLQERPHASLAVLEVLSRRLRRTDEFLADAAFLDLPARLAKKLVELADAHGAPDPKGVAISLRLGYREMAEMVGTDVDTVRRWLTRFEQRGLIDASRGRITLLRPDDLRMGLLYPGGEPVPESLGGHGR